MPRFQPANPAAVLMWSSAVLLGLIGYGRVLASAIGGEPARKAGWGLHAVWGMAVFILTGGILALAGVCGETTITAMVLAGILALATTLVRGGLPTRESFRGLPWQAVPLAILATIVFAGGLFRRYCVNAGDDPTAYFEFCEKLLATGSFDEPFSWRRLASLGGYTLLQSAVIARTSYSNANAFDMGICPAILLGLVLGFRRGSLARSPLGLLIGFLAVTTPMIRLNSTSYLAGSVMLIGLFVTLDLAATAEEGRRRLLAAAGLIAAGLCSLRAQIIPAAALTLGIFWTGSWLRDRRPAREALADAACIGVCVFASLLPWMIMGMRSNSSPLYPIFQGNSNTDCFPISIAMPLARRLSFPGQIFHHSALVPLLLCMAALPGWRHERAGKAMAFATFLASLLLAWKLTVSADDFTIPRYVQPMLFAGAICSLMAGATCRQRVAPAWAAALLALTVGFSQRITDLVSQCYAISEAGRGWTPYRNSAIHAHQQSQALVPEGRRILVCTDFPVLFDQRRNPIWIIDMPNSASPAPGLPFQKPPAEMKNYLRNLGVEYLIFTDFVKSNGIYERKTWEDHAVGNTPLWRSMAPYYLDFFDTMERLAASETVVGSSRNLTVVQLRP